MSNDKKNNKLFMRAKKVFIKMKQIEKEFEKGEFSNFNYYIDHATNSGDLNYALEWSAYYGHLELVKKVVNLGANPNNSNSAPIQMASRNGHILVLKYLMEIGSTQSMLNINILVEAIEFNHLEIVQYLLGNNDYGIILCDVNADHDYALRTAVNLERIEIVELLIKSGADINIFDAWCLNTAIKKENIGIIKLLLEANINKKLVQKIKNRCENPNPEIDNLINQFLCNNLC